jgi:3-methyladenine DNA glycosylase AlkD
MTVRQRPRVATPKRTAPKRSSTTRVASAVAAGSGVDRTKSALAELERKGTKSYRDGLLRYGIVAPKAFGVSMANIKVIAKRLGRDHALAASLWATGWYEARLLASLVAEADRITASEMDRWCRDFDNWAVCDTACFHLFDRSPLAFRKVTQWAGWRGELERRAAFALLASLALHDKKGPDAPFVGALPLIEKLADDERNFVKKAVSWALRAIGRRNVALNDVSVTLARRLAGSSDATRRWVGKDVLRDLTKPAVIARLTKKKASTKTKSR